MTDPKTPRRRSLLKGAAVAAGDQPDGESFQRRLMADPFEEGVEALAQQGGVVTGVRIAGLLVAGEEVEDQGGKAGGFDAGGEVRLAGVLMMAGGAGIRQFFVQRHGYHLGRASNPLPWAIAGVLIIAAVIVWLAPTPAAPTAGKASATNSIAPNADSARAGGQNGYETVAKVLEQRCLQCHGAQVQMKNVRLDSPEQVKVHAQNIYQQVVVTRQMPMNNATQITDAERALIGDWFKAGAKTP